MKGASRPSNAKKLYMDEKTTEIGEVNDQKNRKVKGRKIAKKIITEIEQQGRVNRKEIYI